MPLLRPGIRPRRPAAARRGVALVIVLAFVVLLTGLLVAFFARVTNERNVANSSSNTDKADLLARSALDTITGDLKQEIAQGSTATTVGSGTTATVIYTPTAPANAVPARSGTAASLPNLVRTSVRGISASPVNSATDVSANGRSISAAQWNSHYLLPRATPGSASTDSTPITDFVPPDWVLVNRTGPETVTPPTAWSSTMSDPTASNQNYVLGRYAYAVYDEGGLLDANVAGYSSNMPASLGSNRKGSAFFADLTQFTAANGNPLLTQTPQIDALVGWRHHASTQPSVNYPAYTFNGTSATQFFNLVTGTLNGLPDPTNLYVAGGYLTLPNATVNNQTDQALVSRGQLIQFSRSLGFSPDVLQYFGTFSRDLEQPSFVPNPARPRVQNTSPIANSSAATTAPFGGGNDAYVATPPAAATDINPPFPAVRVAAAFTRPDGSAALVGDPLVVKRFPLSRLQLISSAKTNTNVQTDDIYRNFGLYRGSASSNWSYNHGNSTGIYRLDQMKGLSREPDFFELLKAAINVGSVGKSASYSSNNYAFNTSGLTFPQGKLQNMHDVLSDLQILQIGANIIDQSKADNFPTRIQFSGSNNYEVRGIEDLPYLYRFRNWAMRTGGGSTGVLLMQPELWNPHSLGSSANVPTGSTPSSFRVRVTLDPTASGTAPVTLSVLYGAQDAYVPYSTVVTLNNLVNPGLSSPPPPNPTTPPSLLFNAGEVNGAWGFREPTLLATINRPTTSALQGDAYADNPTYTPDPNRMMTGLTIGSFPWMYTGPTTKNGVTTQTTDPVYKINEGSTGPTSCFRFYLEYQSGGNWVTYDEQLTQYDGATNEQQMQIHGAATALTLQQVQPNSWAGAGRTDPRTSRWGFHGAILQNLIPAIDPSGNENFSSSYVNPSNTYATERPDTGLSYGDHFGGRKDAGFYGAGNNYSGSNVAPGGNRGFQHGYWTENATRATSQTDTGDSGLRFFVDPDGVPRRAMGGYSTDIANGGTMPATVTYGLPMVTANYGSRPTILHRPFRSVAELGYVFRETPWSNLNFSFPESADSALLDVFCVNEITSSTGLVAGHVDLNTRQAPVLQAILAGTLLDKDDSTSPVLGSDMAATLAAKLVARTSNTTDPTQGPLVTRADLVGTSTFSGDTTGIKAKASLSTALTNGTMDPNTFYTGFSADAGTLTSTKGTTFALIPRQREAVMRALADVGNTRVWNLLIDVTAQSGRYLTTSPQLASFMVEGERRYWLHVAIDRVTGQVLDRQLEPVTE